MSIPNPSIATNPQRLSHIPLRIAVVQFNPKIGQVDANIARARELCLKLQPNSIDLLCFPEMAFTGYVFDSAAAISPYLEEPRNGSSSLFYQEIAKRLGCYVAGGYPERLEEEEERASLAVEPEPEADGVRKGSLAGGMEIPPVDGSLDAQEQPPDLSDAASSKPQLRVQVGANSAILFGPSGDWVGGYRKTNLFETDMTWAKPGTGLTSFSLPLSTVPPLSDSTEDDTTPHTLNITLGICMDLNPHPPALWTSAEGPFELADHCAENKSRLLLLLNAWLYSGLDEEGELQSDEKEKEMVHKDEDSGEDDKGERGEQEGEEEEEPSHDEPDWYTLRYWTARLQPLWRRDGRRRGSNETVVSGSSNGPEGSEGKPPVEEAVEDVEEEEKPPHETIVVICNRNGNENGKTFAGSSAIFSMRAGSGRPKLLDMMGRQEEGVRVWNLLV